MTRIIVSDTGPVLHLSETHAHDLLELAGSVSIPPAVSSELLWLLPSGIPLATMPVVALVQPFSSDAALWASSGLLHAGESEAIALSRQLSADWFLTDDAAARMFAQALGNEVHGSLGIVLWAAASGHIDRSRAESTLKSLASSSLWVSPRVLRAAETALNGIFP